MRSAMPNRIYQGSQPPTFLDHVYAHPWQLAIAAWSAFIGVVTACTHIAGTYASPSVDRIPLPLIVVLASMLVAGGVLVALGIFDTDRDLMVGYRRERVGLVLIGTAWIIYAVAVIAAFPESISAWTSGLTLGTACALRLRATYREESRMRGGA